MILPNQLNKCGCNLFLISFLSPVWHVLVDGWMDGPHLPSIFFIKDAFRKRKVFSDVNHLVPYWAKIVKTFTFILSSPSIFLTAFPVRGLWGATTCPNCHRAKDRLHSGQTLSPSQGFFQSVASLRRWYNLLFYCRNGRFSKCVTVQAVTETRDGTNSLTLQRTNKLVSRATVC